MLRNDLPAVYLTMVHLWLPWAGPRVIVASVPSTKTILFEWVGSFRTRGLGRISLYDWSYILYNAFSVPAATAIQVPEQRSAAGWKR